MGIRLENKPDKVAHMVLCAIDGEEELEKVGLYLEQHKVQYHAFYEPDYDTGFTAICTEPIYGEQRKLFKKFKLLKH
jgi:hypothetical protein